VVVPVGEPVDDQVVPRLVAQVERLDGDPDAARARCAAVAGGGEAAGIAVVLNFLGFNPMRALVWSGIVQGFSTPPLLLLIMLMTNNRQIMGDKVNSRWMNAIGWLPTAAVFSASAGLVVTWFL